MRRFFAILFVLLIVVLIVLLSKAAMTGNIVREQDYFSFKVLFCSEMSCIDEIKSHISNSNNTDCALYNFRKELINPQLRVVTDDSYKENFSFLKKGNKNGIMHDKFCIFNNKTIMTGSFNPSSSRIDRNNMIIINSSSISRNYEDEFNELWSGNFGNGSRVKKPRVVMENAIVENYFCPEDDCAQQLISEIDNSNSTVLFMSYSFTHKGIANSLVMKKLEGLDIRGVIDSSSDKNVYGLLAAQGIDARLDLKKGIMHHKVFIIDNETVITGSFNPTYSGDERNDENILIIHNKDVASEYLSEFSRVWN